MNLRQLRYFTTVAAERNFSRAAERLSMAQPPLSRAIQMLEAELGVALFDRSVRPLALTELGKLFHEQAQQILARVGDLSATMKTALASQHRRFTIGYVASTIYARLPDIIRAFRQAAPTVDLVMVEASSIEQITALKEGRIDVGFGRIEMDDPAVRRIILRQERLVLALPATHRLAGSGAPVSLQELAGEPLILFPRSPRPSFADQVIVHLRKHEIEPRSIQEVRELQIAIGLVAAEEGVALVPTSVSRARSHDVAYCELLEPITSPIIMSHRINEQSPELRTISSAIAATYQSFGYALPDGLSS